MKTFLKIIFLICFILEIQINVKAQSVIWRQIIGGQYREIGRDVIELRDGGYLMVGEKQVPALQTYLVKLDRFGNIVWQKTIGDSIHFNESFAVTEDPLGNIYLPISNARLIKMNSTGTILWDKSYSSTNIAFFTGISFVDNYKNLMLVGLNTISSDYTSSLTKLDSNGNLIWNKAYYDSIPSISVYSSYSNCYLFLDNFYFISGNKGINGFVIKTDTSGNRLWTKRYTQSQYIFSIVQNSENTFIATGVARNGYTHCLKFDNNGDTIWAKTYVPGFGYYKIVRTFNYNYAMGTIVGENFTRIGIIDSSGNIISVYTNSYPEDVMVNQENLNSTSDSGLVLTGSYAVFPDPDEHTDALIFKVDKKGNMVSIKTNSEIVSENFEINTFPNPYNLSFKLSFIITQTSKVVIEIFDLTGKKLREIENKFINTGKYQYIINTRELSSGIYFISFNINNKIYSKKILLIK